MIFEVEVVVLSRFRRRPAVGDRRRFDARQRRHPLERAIPERLSFGLAGVRRPEQGHRRGEQAVGVDADADAIEPVEARHDQHGGDHERRGQREFRRDERAPEAARRRSVARGPDSRSAGCGPRASRSCGSRGRGRRGRSARRCRRPAPRASRTSTPTSRSRRPEGCSRCRRRRRAAAPAPRPPAPVAAAPAQSTALSATRCCSSRPRDAPSALRIASSRLRASARATSRLIALAHAIRSTQPTAASATNSVAPMSPTTRVLRSNRPHVAFSS